MIAVGVICAINFGSKSSWNEVADGSASFLAASLEYHKSARKETSGVDSPLPELNTDGWNPIHVYYGDMNHITDDIPEEYRLVYVEKNKNGERWFSQHNQDLEVFHFLKQKRNGFFVDLAANDAVWASNTFALEQNYNWTGICIEPNPYYWFRLSFRKCHAVGAMVGNVTKEQVGAKFSNGPYGGIVSKDFDNKRLNQVEIQRYTATLEHILDIFNAPKVIDYMSLDVEGAEEFIMSSFSFNTYKFLTMSIERPKPGLRALLEKNGYVFVKDFRRGDTLWAHESMVEA